MILSVNRFIRSCSFALVAASFLISMQGSPARADEARSLNPNALSVEVLGRGFLYTVQYDRAMTEDVFAGIGIGTVGIDNLDGSDANSTAVLIPVYVGYYFMREHGTPFVTAGASVVANNSTATNHQTALGSMKFPTGQIVGSAGAGWEERTDTGFLFRVTGYAMIGGNVKPWVGATFGYAF
ncbi:MAG: hypothetical protein P4M08_03460 [Oligoflexia bacterium]|nr:hypothetical protein [Oligoflexia bacterium]